MIRTITIISILLIMGVIVVSLFWRPVSDRQYGDYQGRIDINTSMSISHHRNLSSQLHNITIHQAEIPLLSADILQSGDQFILKQYNTNTGGNYRLHIADRTLLQPSLGNNLFQYLTGLQTQLSIHTGLWMDRYILSGVVTNPTQQYKNIPFLTHVRVRCPRWKFWKPILSCPVNGRISFQLPHSSQEFVRPISGNISRISSP